MAVLQLYVEYYVAWKLDLAQLTIDGHWQWASSHIPRFIKIG